MIFNEDYRFFIEGIEVIDADQICHILNLYKCKQYLTTPKYIIFDRYILSGRVYNYYLPKMYITHKYNEYLKKQFDVEIDDNILCKNLESNIDKFNHFIDYQWPIGPADMDLIKKFNKSLNDFFIKMTKIQNFADELIIDNLNYIIKYTKNTRAKKESAYINRKLS